MLFFSVPYPERSVDFRLFLYYDIIYPHSFPPSKHFNIPFLTLIKFMAPFSLLVVTYIHVHAYAYIFPNTTCSVCVILLAGMFQS